MPSWDSAPQLSSGTLTTVGVAILLTDIALCVALFFTESDPRDQLDRGWAVNCPPFQGIPHVRKHGERCRSLTSVSNGAILSQMVDKKMAQDIDKNNTVRKEDIPIKPRPHGLLKGINMTAGIYQDTTLMQTIETWFGRNGGFSELDFGVRLRHGRLIVPRSGLYQIFSHIDFTEGRRPRNPEPPQLEHRMFKYNILREDRGEEEILQGGFSPCLARNRWEQENVGSYAGAVLPLRAGDELSVRVTHIHLLAPNSREHYFGIHRLGP